MAVRVRHDQPGVKGFLSAWLAHNTISQPDKAAIKEALKAGHLIPGAQLVSRRSWRIH